MRLGSSATKCDFGRHHGMQWPSVVLTRFGMKLQNCRSERVQASMDVQKTVVMSQQTAWRHEQEQAAASSGTGACGLNRDHSAGTQSQTPHLAGPCQAPDLALADERHRSGRWRRRQHRRPGRCPAPVRCPVCASFRHETDS